MCCTLLLLIKTNSPSLDVRFSLTPSYFVSTLYLSTLDPSQCLDSCQTRLWKPRRRSKRTAGIVDRRKTVRPITRDTCWRENEGSKRMPYTCPLPLNSPLPDTNPPSPSLFNPSPPLLPLATRPLTTGRGHGKPGTRAAESGRNVETMADRWEKCLVVRLSLRGGNGFFFFFF